MLNDEDGVPVEKFIDWLTEAKDSFERTEAADGEEARHEFVSEILENAGHMLGAVYHDNFLELIQAAAPVAAQISYQMGGVLRRLGANKSAVREGSRQITELTQNAVRVIPKLIRLTSDTELREALENQAALFKNINSQLGKYK